MSNTPNIEKNNIIHKIDAKHNYRYERKFTIPNTCTVLNLENIIKQNNGLFREVFYERQVNNIYFDTAGYNDYFDNVLGVSNRKKIRIRWYGNTFGKIEKPVLEIKIKKGLVGDKWSYRLTPFQLNNDFTDEMIKSVFSASGLPLPILESVHNVMPTILNSYFRKYYLSENQKFRITFDHNLLYYKIDKRFNNFKLKPNLDINKIVELKYALCDDQLAHKISDQFSFRLNKNSKYVNGINTIKQFAQ